MSRPSTFRTDSAASLGEVRGGCAVACEVAGQKLQFFFEGFQNPGGINKRKISESVRTASAESVKTNSKKSLLSHSESTRVRH
jgi:hypothetical protein